MLDIDLGLAANIAKLLRLLNVNEFGTNYVVFSLPPLEKFNILLILGVVVEADLVLLDLLVGEGVAVEGEVGRLVREGGPVLGVEGGRFIGFWLFITHSL